MAVRLKDDKKKWPSTIIAFDIDNDLPSPDRVTSALRTFEQHLPGFYFIPRTGEASYLRFKRDTVCGTSCGYNGPGAHVIQLADACGAGEVLHEIMHALGFAHEHCRLDRDTYVHIVTERIIPDKAHNFDKVSASDFMDVDDYDYWSIMHYDAYAFTKEPLSPTIVPKNTNYFAIIGQKNLSTGDITAVSSWYDVGKASMVLANNSASDVYVWIRWGGSIWKLYDTLLTPGKSHIYEDGDPKAQFTVGVKDTNKTLLFELNNVPLFSAVAITDYMSPGPKAEKIGLLASWASQPIQGAP